MPSLQHQLLARVIPLVRRSREVHDPEAVRRDVLSSRTGGDPVPPGAHRARV